MFDCRLLFRRYTREVLQFNHYTCFGSIAFSIIFSRSYSNPLVVTLYEKNHLIFFFFKNAHFDWPSISTTNYRFSITLFGEYVMQLNQFISTGDTSNVVLAFLHCKMDTWHGMSNFESVKLLKHGHIHISYFVIIILIDDIFLSIKVVYQCRQPWRLPKLCLIEILQKQLLWGRRNF